MFKRGDCKIAGEFITEPETIKLLWNENREILELYTETEFVVESFTDLYNPTPEEITMFNLEFGEESTEAYLKFLESGAK